MFQGPKLNSANAVFRVKGGLVANYNVVPVTNRWYHWAVTRQSNTVRIFIDGQLGATSTYGGTMGSSSILSLGNYGGGGSYGLQGYLDEVRITRGVARYTTSFTPPVGAFPNP